MKPAHEWGTRPRFFRMSEPPASFDPGAVLSPVRDETCARMRHTMICSAQRVGHPPAGMTHQEILADFPYLTEIDIRACLAFAADRERRLETMVA